MKHWQLNRWIIVFVALGASALTGCSSTLTVPEARSTAERPEPVRATPRTGARPSTNESSGRVRTQVVNTALDMIGTPYRYGGNTPSGFDCSGLVHYAYRAAGISVPRTTGDQLDTARGIALPQARPGDLLFFKMTSKPDHVGIFIGNGQFVHAPSSGKQVGVAMLSDPFWNQSFVGARRLYQQ